MALVVYNTMERRKVPFEPLEPGKVGIYGCGITPYDYSHLGHARQYVIWDVFRNYLEWSGYKVRYIQNFTDVDDKIIGKAVAEGSTVQAVSSRYIDDYFDIMNALGVRDADVYPKVTEHIPEIIALVERLVEKGVAYAVDGDVYFHVPAYGAYGKLSGRNLDDMRAGARVDVDDRKRDPMDFAVWKSAKPGEPAWDSPWGPGRPGWHIECSAMAARYLGEAFDIHGGGSDLIFPHHENEIAQSEGATGRTFARYWMHHGFITVNSEKMSKSLGNFKSVRDLLKVYDPQDIRMFLVSTHYRSPISFTDAEIQTARKSRERLANGYRSLVALASAGADGGGTALVQAASKAKESFVKAMDDDFNTALALASLFDFVRDANRIASGPGAKEEEGRSAADALTVFGELLGILGISMDFAETRRDGVGADSELVGNLMNLIIDIRKEARAAKNWAVSDKIRDGLKSAGVILEDTPEGTRWKRSDG